MKGLHYNFVTWRVRHSIIMFVQKNHHSESDRVGYQCPLVLQCTQTQHRTMNVHIYLGQHYSNQASKFLEPGSRVQNSIVQIKVDSKCCRIHLPSIVECLQNGRVFLDSIQRLDSDKWSKNIYNISRRRWVIREWSCHVTEMQPLIFGNRSSNKQRDKPMIAHV